MLRLFRVSAPAMLRQVVVMLSLVGCRHAAVGAADSRLSGPTSSARAIDAVASSSTYAFVNGQWLGTGGFKPTTMYAVNGVFRTRRPPRVDNAVDLHGGFVVPPFGDAHTHNLDGPFNLDAVRAAYVSEGTFYVQVLTNTRSGAERARSQFNQPCTLDVAYANGGLTGTLSHPFLAYEPRAMGLYSDWAAHSKEIWQSRKRENDAYWFIDSAAELEAKWPRILAGKPDVIKIFLLDASESALPPPDTGLSSGHGLKPSLIPLIVRRAHDAGLRVAAHVETANDFRIATRAGVDMFAHLPGYEMDETSARETLQLTEADARMAAKRKVVVVPTLSLAVLPGGKDSTTLVDRRLALQRENIELLRRHGVRVAVGSDWFGRTASNEIDAMQRLGLWSNSQLLDIWGSITPQAIFPARRLGVLAEGYEASFLVLADDPLRDFAAVRRIQLRVKQGCILQ